MNVEGQAILKDIVIRLVDDFEKIVFSKFLSVDFEEKMGVGGGYLPTNIYSHLKRGLELSIFDEMSSLPIFYDHWFNMITPAKNKTNKHASVIFLLAKNANFHIFVHRSLKTLQRGSMVS